MKVKKFLICYVGILLGTLLVNFYLKDFSVLFQDFHRYNETGLLMLMIRRSIEIIILIYIGMVINRKIWICIIDFLSGVALGVLVSLKAMFDGLFSTILYFLLVLIIVTLYNVVLKLAMAESQDKQEIIHTKLHNSLLNKFIVFAIIFVNAFLEMTVMKIF